MSRSSKSTACALVHELLVPFIDAGDDFIEVAAASLGIFSVSQGLALSRRDSVGDGCGGVFLWVDVQCLQCAFDKARLVLVVVNDKTRINSTARPSRRSMREQMA